MSDEREARDGFVLLRLIDFEMCCKESCGLFSRYQIADDWVVFECFWCKAVWS